MTDSPTDSAPGVWKVPECPFAIEYSLRVMDDIRLAVMDAFFSLPRGGAEIGGVLIGQFAPGRVIISEYMPLDCEHAMGPSFTLSRNDEIKLEDLLSEVGRASAAVAVGWYHSHTRSEIFLSDADLTIHRKFFPKPNQVALVLKPHTFQPMRCGFFFRESNGSVQASATYREFVLEALPMRPVPSGGMPMTADRFNTGHVESESPADSILVEASLVEPIVAQPPPVAEPEPEPVRRSAVEPEPEPAPRIVDPPELPIEPDKKQSRRWLKVVLAVGLVCAIGGAVFQSRQLWWPKAAPVPAQQPVAAFTPVGLSTIDVEGQLQIHWDRSSQAVRQATGGLLTINDLNPVPRQIKLDRVMLQTGSFTYEREGESVTVVLALNQTDGRQAHEVASFLGKPPKPPAENEELRHQRDAATEKSANLLKELAAEVDRNRKLQKQLDDARAALRAQTRKRLATQLPK